MRAAFVAVMDGKQAAILVPTTLLAQQHYQNFQDRFADLPVNIAQLSRFVSKKQQTETLEAISKGEVEIIIFSFPRSSVGYEVSEANTCVGAPAPSHSKNT